MIPLATTVAERAVRGVPEALGAVGALLVAGGLFLLSELTHKELGLVVLALALCGAGLGLGFPGLTTICATRRRTGNRPRCGHGRRARRRARARAARANPDLRQPVGHRPEPGHRRGDRRRPVRAAAADGQGTARAEADRRRRPGPPRVGHRLHARVPSGGRRRGAEQRAALAQLKRQLDAIVQRAVTSAFKPARSRSLHCSRSWCCRCSRSGSRSPVAVLHKSLRVSAGRIGGALDAHHIGPDRRRTLRAAPSCRTCRRWSWALRR